jgi:hypothetical protein
MKIVITTFFMFSWSLAFSSKFEIKVALNLFDCINCSNHLYSLNNVSKKYKITFIYSSELSEDSSFVSEEIIGYKIKDYSIEVSDSLYLLYSVKSQNFVSVFKNNRKIFAFPLKNINSYIDSLNLLSYEEGDTINIGFKPEIKVKSKLKDNKLYILNPRKNSLFVTNTINQTSFKFTLKTDLVSAIFSKAFNNNSNKLTEITNYYQSLKKKHEIKINSFDLDSNSLYLFVDIPFIEEISGNFLDTFISNISSILVYKNGSVNPEIYILNNTFPLKEYDFSSHQLSVKNEEAFVNVFLKNKNLNKQNSLWVCSCKLKEDINFNLSNCILRPKLHINQEMGSYFGEFLTSGDYIINSISNELINLQTKSIVELPLPIEKIHFNKYDILNSKINFFLNDLQVKENLVQIIYTSEYSYYLMKYDLINKRVIENYILFEDGRVINGAPKFFVNDLIYFFPKNSKYFILKKIKT